MAKIIYSIKLYMFRKQLQLQRAEQIAQKSFLIFFLKIYLRNWFQAENCIASPRNDLKMLKDLNALQESFPVSAGNAAAKFKTHL